MKKLILSVLLTGVLLLSACSSTGEGQIIDMTESNDISSLDDLTKSGVKIVKIVSGSGFEVLLTDYNQVYFQGGNQNLVLGSSFPDIISDPIQIPFDEEIVNIYAGDTNIACVGKSNKIHYIGCDMLYIDNIMEETKRIYPPEVLGTIEGIKDITMGGFTCHVLTHSGEVYAFGANVNATLGIEKDVVSEFTLIPFDEKIDSISEAAGGLMFVAESGNLYGCGLIFGEKDEKTIIPKKLMSGIKQSSVTHTTGFALTNEGEVYVIGSNYRGEAGVSTEETAIREFTKVEFDEPIEALYSAKYFHTFAKSKSGKLYGWGSPIENSNNSTKPVDLMIDGFSFEHMSISGEDFYTSDKDGNWFFYDNKSNQLLGDEPTTPTPFVLEVSE
ncbi:MAG TPA: hypothetical protein VJX95_05910 [Oscillospiraceae bacterium]|nr:hypothetical protein [Oscillospiraceae bacterium]